MTRSRYWLPSLIALSCLIGFSSVARGQSRVFASASAGNDANACANILTPCQTLQGAVNQVAAGGEVIVLTSGGYGPVSITKSLTIEAAPGVLAFIHPPGGHAVDVNAGSSDTVVLRGLTLNEGPFSNGINVSAIGTLRVDKCIINGFDRGIQFGPAGQLFVTDTTAANNTAVGIRIETGTASIERCRLESNGSFAAHGGLVLATGAKATVRDTMAAGNFRGFVALGPTSIQLNIENCVATGNVVGIFTHGDSSVVARVSNTTVTNNTLFGIEHQDTSAALSRGNNTVEGNAGGETFSGSYTAK